MPDIPEHELSSILSSLPERICDLITRWDGSLRNRPALIEESASWTYSQLASLVCEARRWLSDIGVRPGDRVMLVCDNCSALVAVFLALNSLDAWPVPVNARLSAREVDEIRNHCGARRVIYFTSASPQAREHARRQDAEALTTSLPGAIAVGRLDETVQPEPLEDEPGQRTAALIYTSGTTGRPKGVMLTHRNLLFVAAVSARIRSLTVKDRLYGILPISHSVGLSSVMLGSLISGASLYLASRFDPVAALRALNTGNVTVMLGSPSMFSLIADYAHMKGWKALKFPSLRIISSSGAPLHPNVKAEVERLFGMTLYNNFGITECSPNISQAVVGEQRDDTSVGKILPGVEVRLVGASGSPVPEGEIGELWVRGPNVMKGYYRSPQETAEAIDSEGWFNTRDLVRLENGYLFIVGRTKDMIVRFGLNVYPSEVEAVLNLHPAVMRSAVVGRQVDGAQGGEEVVAYLQLTPSAAVSEMDLAHHATQHLAPYKRPSQFIFVGEMPLTPTGKIVKGDLANLPALTQAG